MIARTHDTAAFTALSVIFLLSTPASLSLSTAILSVIAALIGGIAPDIDQPTAPLWRNLPVGKYFGRTFSSLIGGHRFISHSLIGVSLFIYALHWLLVFFQPVMATVDIGMVTWAFGIGIMSHLVMDSLTKEGVPWLLPIPYKFGFPPVRALRITTDSWRETRIVLPVLFIFNIVFIFLHYDQLAFILRHTITR